MNVRYAYGVTAALLLSGSAFALATGGSAGPVTAGGAATLERSGIAPHDAPDSFADLVAQLQPAVVNIATKKKVKVVTGINPFTGEQRESTQQQQTGGSGFLVSADGYVVTNNHVVSGGPNGDAVDEVTITMTDGREFGARIIGRDAQSDLALLKVDATGLPFVEMADSSKARVGDWVIAIGNPLNVGSTVTAGIISAKQRAIGQGGAYDRFLQTDAAINHGNSGGPLFNLDGKVIGINNQIASTTDANIGVGFAIPAEEAIPVVESLRKGARPVRGYLGIQPAPIDPATADALGIAKAHGEKVMGVLPNGGAAKAGLQAEDIVLKVNGSDITPDNTLSRQVANIKPGGTAKLDILREGKAMQIAATVGTRPTDDELQQSRFNPKEKKEFKGSAGDAVAKTIRDALGISVVPLTPDVARELELTSDVKGVVVDIEGDGSAAQAGLNRGDIIVSVNQKALTSAKELAAMIDEAKNAGRKNIYVGIKHPGGGPTQYGPIPLD